MLTSADYKNYCLEECKELPELNGQGYVLRHAKTGARVLLVENEDTNKVFSIAFRTPPADDTGVAHILEHSVLCGSKKFPSKDPFVELAKGSLNTFLNAMTYSDKTVYPIASCNDQDYHNLMHVYLDAVFYPNIYKKEEILKQEGWHYEMESPDSDLTFNGVVYNEMKGVMSSPDSILERKVQASLLKDTPYAFESGGDPDAIPTLTRENFLAFHTRYYHPSNSYIYLYGNVDFAKELAFIDQEYLSHFDKREVDSEIPMQALYEEPVRVEDTYSVSEDMEDGIYLSYNVLVGDNADREKAMAMAILDYVLFTMPGAPVKKRLIEAGLGTDVDSFYDGGIQQPIFSISVKNVGRNKEEAFVKKLEEILADLSADGISKKALYSAINSFEFRFRESNYGSNSKGLIYGLNFLNTWLYDDRRALDLADSLTPLASLKEKIESGYFEKLIRDVFLDNSHKSFVNLYPETGKNEKADAQLKAQLARLKASLTRQQLYLLQEDSRRLKEFQETPSTQEELEAIPMLSLSDISPDALPFKNKEMEIGGLTTVVHEYHTNGIAYFDFCFDMSDLPEELVPYATLLVDFYRYVDTRNFTYNDLAAEINLKIGGLNFSTGISSLVWKKGGYRPYFSVNMKCLEEQIEDGINLAQEVLINTLWTDFGRMKEIISEEKTRMDVRIPATGHVFASGRAMSYVSPAAKYKEEAEGICYYHFICDLDAHFDERKEQMALQLARAQNCIFRKDNLTVSLTGEFDYKSLLDERFENFGRLLWDGPCVRSKPVYPLYRANEAFKTSSKVNYVAAAGCYETEDQGYTGALRVLRTILSYDYLWVNVRVTGGAYGCSCSFSRDGYGTFASYRDPKVVETLDAYHKAVEYIRNFDVSARDMTKYIIGTISGMDQPLEPSALGARSFAAYRSGITFDMIQKDRDQVLGCDQDQIRALADCLEHMLKTSGICVIGNENTLEEQRQLFATVETLSR